MGETRQTFKRMTVVGLLDETLSHYRRHLGLFFLIAAIAQLPLAVVSVILLPGPPLEDIDQSTILSTLEGGGSMARVILSVLIGGVVGLLSNAALVRAAGDSYLGLHPNFGNSYVTGIMRLGRLVIMTLSMAVVLVLLAITIVGIPFAIYFGVRWLVASQAIVLENVGAWEGLARSYRLVRGNWWRCLGIAILVFLVVIGATIVFHLPFGLITWVLNATMPWIKETSMSMISSLFSAAVASIIAPAGAIAFTLLYADLRAREETVGTPPRDISTPSQPQ